MNIASMIGSFIITLVTTYGIILLAGALGYGQIESVIIFIGFVSVFNLFEILEKK